MTDYSAREGVLIPESYRRKADFCSKPTPVQLASAPPFECDLPRLNVNPARRLGLLMDPAFADTDTDVLITAALRHARITRTVKLFTQSSRIMTRELAVAILKGVVRA